MDNNLKRFEVLKKIYDDHLTGRSKFSADLSIFKGEHYLNLIYLIDKGYLHCFGQNNTEIQYRISAKGIEKVESGETTL